MFSLSDNFLVDVGVKSSATFVLRPALIASPVNFSVPHLLSDEGISFVFYLAFSPPADYIFDSRSIWGRNKGNFIN